MEEHTDKHLDMNLSESPFYDFITCWCSCYELQALCQWHPTSESFYYEMAIVAQLLLLNLQFYESFSLPSTAHC